MRILDLTEKSPAVEQVAEILVDGFRDTGTAAWQTMEDALQDVLSSLQPDRISRIAIDDQQRVLGWIGGIGGYDGHVWELHPLVVRRDRRRQGIGKALVDDFEKQIARRGGHTVWLGTDDENARTSLGGVDIYPDVLERLRTLKNLGGHPFQFYLKLGYHVVGVIPDANGFGKPDILMAKRVSAPSAGQ